MKKVPSEVAAYLRRQGSKGGRKCWIDVPKAERSERARKAVNARWAKARNAK